MGKIDVVGAGMAGLLAAAMLRKDCNAIWEAAPELPNNHSAVLRFRSSVVADTLNIPFKPVDAVKAVEAWRNPIADAIAYSIKTNGSATIRSVLTADGRPARRWIAPSDLISRMAALIDAPVELGQEYPFWAYRDRPVISTIPMPSLMRILGYGGLKDIDFSSRPGTNVIAELDGADIYCSLYVPEPSFGAARISVTGNQMIAECYGGWAPSDARDFAFRCADKIGLNRSWVKGVTVKAQQYAKILPIPEDARRRFIMWASEERGIYSLGRYATWRPGLLLDDLVNDVRVIQRLIAARGALYPHKLKG